MTRECDYSIRRMEEIRQKKCFRKTNAAWNASGVNSPKKIGYLMQIIGDIKPCSYEAWLCYFFDSIADEDKLSKMAATFKESVLGDEDLKLVCNYKQVSLEVFKEMTVCRLVYETWLGYYAELSVSSLLSQALSAHGYSAELSCLSGKDDNRYAVDRILKYNGETICGIQIKPIRYGKGNAEITTKTVSINEIKNALFSNEYGVPVVYIFYTYQNGNCVFTYDTDINAILYLLKNKQK